MLTTISLREWMSSRWAWGSHPATRNQDNNRKYELNVSETIQKKRFSNDLYLENAAFIASLIVERISTNEDTAGCIIEMDEITVTLEVEVNPSASGKEAPDLFMTQVENCDDTHGFITTKFVSVALHRSQDAEEQPPFLRSLGLVLLEIFSHQESISSIVSISPHDGVKSISEKDENDDIEFEYDMLRALSVLDDAEGDALSQSQRQTQRRRSDASSSFSRIRHQYPTLPTSICRLASDLIDSPLATSTSFSSLDDVSDDLDQMVREPDIFLHEAKGIDNTLEFGTRLYGRNEELSQLMDIISDVSMERETGPLELVGIGGYSGTGKSCLVRQVGRCILSRGWIFIQGKFDRIRGDAFSVITTSFESFCMTFQNDFDYCSRVSKAVFEALGPTGVGYLIQLVPSFQRIADLDSSNHHHPKDVTSEKSNKLVPINAGNESVLSRLRRENLLCAFVVAVARAGRPLFLFYDDVQWADASTVEFLQKLIKHLADNNETRTKTMVCVAYRDDEVKQSDLVDRLTAKIKLGGFSNKPLNDFVSSILRLPCRTVSPLSGIVHKKTAGNILFVVEFMKTLESSGKNILTYSLAKRRWIWDADSIAIMPVSDNVAGLLLKRLQCIEETVLKSLIIASCFGSQANLPVMKLLNGMKGVADVVQNLDIAVGEGLLERAGPFFMFVHDSIQQSVYELTPKNEQVQLHVDIGLMLISNGSHASRDTVGELFASAVSHINMALPKCDGGDAAINFTLSQHIVFAKLNLKAGQKAVNEKLDFSLAGVHLKAGISFLPQNSWSDQYDLTLQLYDEYANVLFVQKELNQLHSHTDIILRNAKCIDDKIKAHELAILALTLKGTAQEAMDHARNVLDALGFPFPPTIKIETISSVLNSLIPTTMSLTADQLRTFPLMTASIPLHAMKIMSAIHMPTTFSSPTTFQMLACQMMQLTIKHGLCVESAEAFANLGYCLISLFGNYEAGYRLGKLSLVILDRFKTTNRVAKLYFLVYGFLAIWKEPVQATIEAIQSAINIGYVEGDYKNVLFNNLILNRQMISAGCELSDIRDRLVRLCGDMTYDKSKKGFFSPFHNTLGDLYCVMALTGEARDMFGISPKENEEKLLEKYFATKNSAIIQTIQYHRLYKAFWFRDYDFVMECCRLYETYTQTTNIVRINDIFTALFWSLSSLIISRRRERREMVAEGEKVLLKMQHWEKSCKWNAENKVLLLKAEIHYSKGEREKAKTAYEKSIQSANEHKFIHEEALANELFGIFCVEEGDPDKGNKLLENAQQLYERWGAKKKAEVIFDL